MSLRARPQRQRKAVNYSEAFVKDEDDSEQQEESEEESNHENSEDEDEFELDHEDEDEYFDMKVKWGGVLDKPKNLKFFSSYLILSFSFFLSSPLNNGLQECEEDEMVRKKSSSRSKSKDKEATTKEGNNYHIQ